MKKFSLILFFTTILLASLVIASCSKENEWEKFEAVEFETVGLSLQKSTTNINSFYAQMPYEGGDITFKAIGKNRDNGFLNYIRIDGIAHELTNISGSIIVNEDWGKIERVSTDPHITMVTLYPNHSDNTRNIELFFGAGYKTSNILISQLKNK